MKHGKLNTLGRIFLWLYYWFDLYVHSLFEKEEEDGGEEPGGADIL